VREEFAAKLLSAAAADEHSCLLSLFLLNCTCAAAAATNTLQFIALLD
jgi:hypothetical protein